MPRSSGSDASPSGSRRGQTRSLCGQTHSSDDASTTTSGDNGDSSTTSDNLRETGDAPNSTGLRLGGEVAAASSNKADCAASSSSSSSRRGGSGSGSGDSDSDSDSRSSQVQFVAAKRLQVVLESDAEHISRHCDKADQKNCVRCQFLKNKCQLEKKCGWVDPLSGNRYTWLMQAPGANAKSEEWGLGCAVCRWAKTGSIMARCQRNTLRNLCRHNAQIEHKKALARYNALTVPGGLTPDPDGGNFKSIQDELLAGPGGETLDMAKRGVGWAHVLKVLEIFQQGHSLRTFSKSMAAIRNMAGDVNPGNDSRTVARQLLRLCAGNEVVVTKLLLDSACVAGISQDAREAHLLVCCRMVLWRLPQEAKNPLADGVKDVLPGGKGPWVAERILGVETLRSDRTAVATAKATMSLIQKST